VASRQELIREGYSIQLKGLDMLRNVIIGRCLGSAALLMVSITGAATANAATRYVSKTGVDANDGSSWATAKLTVQAGLNAAASGDQVWVALGTYVQCITLKDGVALYGGFAGIEDPATFDPADRDLMANKTILDGNQGGSVVTSPSGATAATRIDGFTIRNGIGASSGSFRYGGGIYCSNSSPTIANNTITGNSASGNWYCYGGGLYCSNSSPTIVNNTITSNSASGSPGSSYGYGGGIYCADYSNPTIANNTITDNIASSAGGGLYCSASSPMIANTIVAFNSSGIYRTGSSGTMVPRSNCVFGNVAYNYSGLTDPTGSNGNISADPELGDVVYGSFHISPDSPCRDAGDDTMVQSGWLDMDGQARIQGSHVDIGADESDGTNWPAGPYVVVRVSLQGNDANDGSTWALAKRTVQAGIDAAQGGEVWVKAGTYAQRISLRPYTHVFGGFAGTETARDQRDWVANLTILDGQQGGSVVTARGIGPLCATIDGFTIRNGNGTLSGSNRYGGGIYCDAASPTLANDTITSNSVSGASYGLGGAIYCQYSSPAIANCTITGNTASGISSGYGGGIYCSSSSSPTIAHNTITSNIASTGGAIYCSSSSPTVANNTITGNNALSGGGVYCTSSSPTIANNMISVNSGGGIYLESSSPTINNNAITGNSASTGGGIYCSFSSPTITNNTIAGSSGVAIYCDSSSPTIANTVVAFNSSGIYKTGSGVPVLRYSCVCGNVSYNYSGLTDPTGSDGNISADPRLAGVAYGESHLQPDSPCRDAGDDALVQPGWLDVDGQARVQGSHVDIGADESDGTNWPAGPYVVVRVSPQGNDANDGSTWAMAKRTVQAGINAAAAQGGEVWVKSGTYLERVTLQPYAHLYGGFTGTETSREQRDWAVNLTILDGQQGGSVVSARGIGLSSATVDGFTIRNGNGTLSGSYRYGGGIYCSNSSPTIANNTITLNIAGISSGFGGGIFCDNSFPMLANNTISGNSSAAGGGIFCMKSSPTIANNTIYANSGGGIYCTTSSPLITNNTIMINSGSGISCSSSSPTIANNTITGNIATSGGGIYCSYSSPTIANTIVAFNSSGIYNTNSGPPVLRYSCVFGNTAYNYSGLTDPTGSNGNISADPKLAATVYGDFHIQPDSPCRDTGDDAVVQPGWLDMDGQARIQGSHVDIGADESDGTNWPAGPYVVRVSPQGDDANDGTTWALAKRTVQAGIDAAAAEGGEVWVKSGTYGERISLRTYVYVYGGFVGTETARDQRAWSANVTILDGQQGGSVVTARGTGLSCATIDGFTIRNGNGTLVGSSRYGGGIYCSYSSPMIANNTITSNIASGSSSGGGIYCSYSSPTIANNRITGNNVSSGGGIYCSYSAPTIVKNTVTGNDATSGGGICCSSSTPMIINNTITDNRASGTNGLGGGICCYSSSPTIAINTIAGNIASGSKSTAFGGGIYCSNSSPTIANNTVRGNSATSNGGGIECGSSSSPTIINNTVTANNAGIGGGIDCSSDTYPRIINSTITGNRATSGGGIYCANYSNPTIANTIVAFNSSGIYGLGAGCVTLSYDCVFGNTAYNYSGLTDPAGTYGNISVDPLFRLVNPGPDATWATADDVLDDLRLASTSPCIDAGNNADVRPDVADLDGDGNTTEPLPIDLAGRLRFFDAPAVPDTGAGTPPIVDMGAYEYHPPRPGDFDDDGYVDGNDLDVFEACATGPTIPYNPAALLNTDSGCTLTPDADGRIAADFDADGDVDFADFAVLQRCFSGESNAAAPNCAD
jgi:parallel beta-helix repeat protein